MRHDFLDRYSRMDSRIHRLPALTKLVFAVGCILLAISIPFSSAGLFAVPACFLLAVFLLSRIPAMFFFKRLFFLELVILGIAVLSLFQTDGTWRFVSIMIRSTICIGAVVLLSNTTQFSDLLGILRRFRVPSILVTVLALLYRYLFVLIDESERMHRARLSRTFVRGKSRTWFTLGTMVGQLFIRTSERAERIYSAMAARGWK